MRNNYKIITFTLRLLNVLFLQSGLQEKCCFVECHPICQLRILFLPVIMSFIVLRALQTQANTYAKQHPSIQFFTLCTVQMLHEYTLQEKPEFLHIS